MSVFNFGKVVVGLCPDCNADQFPDGYGAPDRVSPAHFSVRFGRDQIAIRAYMDGVELTDCEECMCGDDGWAICFPPGPHIWIGCECLRQKRVVKRGRVHVESLENRSAR